MQSIQMTILFQWNNMPVVRQNNFSGGRSDSEVSGVQGSYWESKCVNIHERPGIVTANYKLTKESGSVVVDFIKHTVQTSTGNTLFFGDAGNIYSRSASSGAWNLAYTRSAGELPILGAAEFNGFIYYATATLLHRKPYPGLGDWSDHSGDWATFTNGDVKYHPMIINGLYLFIGDTRAIASVGDSHVFTANGTPDVTFNSLPHGYRARCLYNYDIDVLIGTSRSATDSNVARVFRWDTVSASYESSDDIVEDGVRAFIPLDNSVLAMCGGNGNFYFYDGKYLREPPVKKLRGTYTPTDHIEVNPDSVSNHKGLALFGVSRSAGEPCMLGVYSIGRYDKNYPLAINLEYVISQDKTTAIEIGSVHALGNNLLVAWKDSTTYGVDKLDYTAKYTSAYITTQTIGKDRFIPKSFKKTIVSYLEAPGDSSATLSYIKNKGSATAFSTTRTATDEQQLIAHEQVDAGAMQIRVDFNVSGRSAMSVEEIAVYYEPKRI